MVPGLATGKILGTVRLRFYVLEAFNTLQLVNSFGAIASPSAEGLYVNRWLPIWEEPAFRFSLIA